MDWGLPPPLSPVLLALLALELALVILVGIKVTRR